MRVATFVVAMLVSALALAAEAPRIAVWNPVVSLEGGRFPVSKEYLDQVAGWLAAGGAAVERLTTEQVSDAAAFNADKFDALMLEGNAFPEKNIAAYKRFMENGGVLIALAAENPFFNKIARDADGLWRLSPQNPNFAWQTEAVNEMLGLHFRWMMDMAGTGVKHSATPLLETYLPQAKGWALEKPLTARWYVPTSSKVYPLIRSRQQTGGDYTPQVYLVANGSSRAIICASKAFSGNEDAQTWPWSREMVVAIARLAADLHAGKVNLDAQLEVQLPREIVMPGPLEVRSAARGIDPERAQPVVRWGRFDGSRLDLGKTLPAGQAMKIAAGSQELLPGELRPGASVELGLPELGSGPLFLRVRGAFAKTGGILSVRLGNTLLCNERFIYRLSEGTVNIGFAYNNVPSEFTRILFVPPAALSARLLTVANTGDEPIYFDALQIERRSEKARRMGLGLGNGTPLAYDQPTRLTSEICKDWSYFRCCSRPWWIGAPEDPKAWDRFDKHMERYLALSPRVQIQLEGTPAWAAISQQRYQSAGKSRPHMTPPDNEKYAQIVRRIVTKYRGRVEGWEIWNEPNIQTFWMGTRQEYAAHVNAIAPLIRELDPKASIIIGGLAGTVSGYVDPMADELVKTGATRKVDYFGFHPYARNGAWDLAYSLFEGHLMNLGDDIEIYCNESGVNLAKDFGGEGGTLPWQANMTSRALARLLACGVTKVTIFNAGGDGDTYGLLDREAKPRPAYAVFTDYLALAQKGGRRLDTVLLRSDGKPLEGVYVAAASHEDGSVTLVLNPSDVDAMMLPDDPSHDFSGKNNSGWVCFMGKAQYADGKAKLSLAGQPYIGFFKKVKLDPQANPQIAVNVPECAGKWSLELKFSGGQNLLLYEGSKTGEFTFDYLGKLKDRTPRECEISFRFHGGDGAISWVRFPASAQATPAPDLIPLRVLAPLPAGGEYTASARTGATATPIELKVASEKELRWAEVELSLPGRTVVTLSPSGR